MISKRDVLKDVAERFWEMACNYDQIPRDSKVSAFSNSNPFIALYQQSISDIKCVTGAERLAERLCDEFVADKE